MCLQGNAEKSRIIMVGDTIKRADIGPGGAFVEIKNSHDAQYVIMSSCTSLSVHRCK